MIKAAVVTIEMEPGERFDMAWFLKAHKKFPRMMYPVRTLPRSLSNPSSHPFTLPALHNLPLTLSPSFTQPTSHILSSSHTLPPSHTHFLTLFNPPSHTFPNYPFTHSLTYPFTPFLTTLLLIPGLSFARATARSDHGG